MREGEDLGRETPFNGERGLSPKPTLYQSRSHRTPSIINADFSLHHGRSAVGISFLGWVISFFVADVLLLLRKVLSGKHYRQYRGLSNRLKLEKQKAPSERELARVSETEGECGIKEFFAHSIASANSKVAQAPFVTASRATFLSEEG